MYNSIITIGGFVHNSMPDSKATIAPCSILSMYFLTEVKVRTLEGGEGFSEQFIDRNQIIRRFPDDYVTRLAMSS